MEKTRLAPQTVFPFAVSRCDLAKSPTAATKVPSENKALSPGANASIRRVAEAGCLRPQSNASYDEDEGARRRTGPREG
ncbi:MAG: hypothetical protein HYZ87_03050 [Candidatus Omnitrophica bacterium]|nr:hypothetical protein [Candidatus Omnitrophota bacterium]